MVTASQKMVTAEPTNIVIFGVTGDLSKRKLMPALVRMLCCGLVHTDSKIVGVVNNRTEEVWINLVREGMQEFSPEIIEDESRWKKFLRLSVGTAPVLWGNNNEDWLLGCLPGRQSSG